MLTIVSIALVVVAYAAVTIGTFTGGSVTVLGSATGTVTYSSTNDADGTWTTELLLQRLPGIQDLKSAPILTRDL